MTEPKYGPWTAWYAAPDSVCPVARGTRGQVMLDRQTLDEAEKTPPEDIAPPWTWLWKYGGPSRIVFYRVLIEMGENQ